MSVLERLKILISFDENKFVNNSQYEDYLNFLLESAKEIALSRLYPFNNTSTELPSKYNNWLLRACIELNTLTPGIISYSELDLSWNKKTDGLSESLILELIPKVGVPE